MALLPDFKEVDTMNQKKSNTRKYSEEVYNFDSSNDFLTLPDSLITSTREAVFFTWQTLEMQLSQVDPVRYPEIYKALDDRAAAVFESWLSFRYVERCC